jgi:hypothetical protein
MSAKIASAAEVREFFAAKPEALPEGVKIGSRGRIHPDAVKAFNRAKRGKVKYEVGVRAEALTVVTDADGKAVKVPTSVLRSLSTGKRGRFSREVIDAALASL